MPKITNREMSALDRRYGRLLRVDRVLCLIYCIGATVPVYWLVDGQYGVAFDAAEIAAIILVGVAGWTVDCRVLNREIKSEASAYVVTAGFVVTRVLLALWGFHRSIENMAAMFGEEVPRQVFWRVFTRSMLSPTIVWMAIVFGIYRTLYHVAVRHLLKSHQKGITPNHTPDPTALAVTPAADAPVAPAGGRGSS